MNPMILMMVLPLLIITVLPKMMNDPEAKREMEQMQQNMNMQNQVIGKVRPMIGLSHKNEADFLSAGQWLCLKGSAWDND